MWCTCSCLQLTHFLSLCRDAPCIAASADSNDVVISPLDALPSFSTELFTSQMLRFLSLGLHSLLPSSPFHTEEGVGGNKLKFTQWHMHELSLNLGPVKLE